MEYILTFKNTNHAIRAEQRLIEGGVRVGVLPLPPQIRAGCGICLRVDPGELEAALTALADIPDGEMGLYTRRGDNNGRFVYIQADRSVCHDHD